MSVLERLSLRHKEWEAQAKVICKGNIEKADNLLQEFYLRIGEMDQNGTINLKGDEKGYVFVSLNNLNKRLGTLEDKDQKLFKYLHTYDNTDEEIIIEESYHSINNLEGNDYVDESNNIIKEKELFEEMYEHIETYMKRGSYKVKILALNELEGLSQAKISQLTSITPRKVQTAIEKIRKVIKNEYSKEYEEYKNSLKALRDE